MEQSPNMPSHLVVEAISHHVPAACNGTWELLIGGRTNITWALRSANGGTDLVVKLYCGKTNNPLFPNNPLAEASLLRHLVGTALAPRLICQVDTVDGLVNVYELIPGNRWGHDTASVAVMMRRLHSLDAPRDLRVVPDGSDELRTQTLYILSNCANGGDLKGLEPQNNIAPSGQRVLIHGDIVPGNLICNASGVHLIDWQCPAIGDPCEDIAVFLSPAMQSLYRGISLSGVEKEQFLSSYAQPQITERYRALAPWYHWRMAAYCQWQVENGKTDYAPALLLELEALHKS